MKHENRIITFYNPKQALQKDTAENVSKSPLKPKLLMDYLAKKSLIDHFEIVSDFKGFGEEDFLIAHTAEYVKAFFCGQKPLCESNCLEWTSQFADSVRLPMPHFTMPFVILLNIRI